MPSSHAATLYAAHRAALSDPTSVPAWGNASTEEREAWERVAERAEKEVLAPLKAKIEAVAADNATRPLMLDSLPTEEQTAAKIEAFVAREATRWEHAPQIDSAIAGVAGAIAEGAWRETAQLMFATEPQGGVDLHGDVIPPDVARAAVTEYMAPEHLTAEQAARYASMLNAADACACSHPRALHWAHSVCQGDGCECVGYEPPARSGL